MKEGAVYWVSLCWVGRRGFGVNEGCILGLVAGVGEGRDCILEFGLGGVDGQTGNI